MKIKRFLLDSFSLFGWLTCLMLLGALLLADITNLLMLLSVAAYIGMLAYILRNRDENEILNYAFWGLGAVMWCAIAYASNRVTNQQRSLLLIPFGVVFGIGVWLAYRFNRIAKKVPQPKTFINSIPGISTSPVVNISPVPGTPLVNENSKPNINRSQRVNNTYTPSQYNNQPKQEPSAKSDYSYIPPNPPEPLFPQKSEQELEQERKEERRKKLEQELHILETSLIFSKFSGNDKSDFWSPSHNADEQRAAEIRQKLLTGWY